MLSMLLGPLMVTALVSSTAVGYRPLNLGVNIDPANEQGGNVVPDLVTQLGASWVRIEYKDPTPMGSPADPRMINHTGQSIKNFSAAGVKTLLILDYSTLSGKPDASASRDAWSAYSMAFAVRIQQILVGFQSTQVVVPAVEIWNEPDLTSVGNVPAPMYAILLQAAHDVVKKIMPSVTVVLGGLATGDPTYVSQVIQASPHGVLPADAVGIHPYGQRPNSGWPSPTWGFGVLTDLIADYYTVAPNHELWITEIGTTDPNARPDFPFHAFAAVATNSTTPMCSHIFWFCWSDGMVNGFGLVDSQGKHKPSYTSYQTYAKGNNL